MCRRRVLACVVAATTLVACGATTVDSDAAARSGAAAVSTTVALPATTPARLARIAERADALGDLIVEGDERATLDEIVVLWDTIASEVGGNEPDIRRELDHQMELLTTAVDRRRPATAVKASLNVTRLVDTYLERHG